MSTAAPAAGLAAGPTPAGAITPARARVLAWIARLVVGGLFILAAAGKLQDPKGFVKEVRGYQLLPAEMTNAFANVLPWLELSAGGLLVLCLWRREARLVLAVMLVAFTIAKSYAYAADLKIECGCGGDFEFLKHVFNNPQGVLVNITLLSLLGIDHQAERMQPRVGPAAGGRTPVDA